MYPVSLLGGVFAGDCGTDTDHAVQVIGADLEKGYWIVRNSWGSQWGVDGYAYVQMGGKDVYFCTRRMLPVD